MKKSFLLIVLIMLFSAVSCGASATENSVTDDSHRDIDNDINMSVDADRIDDFDSFVDEMISETDFIADSDTAEVSDEWDFGQGRYFTPTGEVSLTIYNNTGELLAQMTAEDEGERRIDLTPPISGELKLIASRDGAYSQLYTFEDGDTINIQLAPLEDDNYYYHGVVFGYGPDMEFQKRSGEKVLFGYQDISGVGTAISDSSGHYAVSKDDYEWAEVRDITNYVTFTVDRKYNYEDIIFRYYAGETVK